MRMPPTRGPSVPDPREWTSSPGPWPGRERSSSPGDARLRLDRVPAWARMWWRSRVAQRRARQWLWQHGGYDVEVLRHPMWRPLSGVDGRRAALGDPGPWPRPAVPRGDVPVAVDVDRYRDLALVVTLVPEPTRAAVGIAVDVFTGAPAWRYQGGSLSSLRRDRAAAAVGDGLVLRSRGWSSAGDSRTEINHALVECGSSVRTVIVERGGEERGFAVPAAGCLFGLVWPEGVTPLVRALDASGGSLGKLDIPPPAGRSTRPRARIRRPRPL